MDAHHVGSQLLSGEKCLITSVGCCNSAVVANAEEVLDLKAANLYDRLRKSPVPANHDVRLVEV